MGASALGGLAIALSALIYAVQLWREQRRRGIKTDWTKTGITLLGVLVICGIAIGALITLIRTDRAMTGLLAFALLMSGGLIILVKAVNRWRPPPL